jgi:hypothetical protein
VYFFSFHTVHFPLASLESALTGVIKEAKVQRIKKIRNRAKILRLFLKESGGREDVSLLF